MSDEQTTEQSNESTNTEEVNIESTISQDSGEQNEVERPDWLPPKFETPEQLATSYKNLESKFHTRRDEIKQELVGELNQEAQADVPVSPGDYSVELEDEDGNPIDMNPDDPMLGWFRDKAHSIGMTNDEFGDFVTEYTNMQATSGPDWNEESQHLGEHAERRLERVDAWIGGNMSEAAYEVFADIPASAGMVQFFEELMEVSGQPRFNMTSESTFQEAVTQDDLRSAMNDPRYWKDKDPAHIAKVQAMSRQVALKKHGALEITQM